MSRKYAQLPMPATRSPFSLGTKPKNTVSQTKKFSNTIEHSNSKELRRKEDISLGVTTQLASFLKQQQQPAREHTASVSSSWKNPLESIVVKKGMVATPPVIFARRKNSYEKPLRTNNNTRHHNYSHLYSSQSRNYSHNTNHTTSSASKEKPEANSSSSAHNSIGRFKCNDRLHTEKAASLNPSQSNIIKKRKVSFGVRNVLGGSAEMKKGSFFLMSRDEYEEAANDKKTPLKQKHSGKQERRGLLDPAPLAPIDQQAVYNQAIESLTANKLTQAVRDFQLILLQAPNTNNTSNPPQKDSKAGTNNYRSSSFLWLAISFKKLGKTEEALEVLNRALMEFPNHYQSYVYRGKILAKLKKFERAKKDLNQAITLDGTKPLAYLAKGDCLRLSGQYKQALQAYSSGAALELPSSTIILLKKIALEFEQNLFDKCAADIEVLLQIQPANSEALCYKGLIQKQQKASLIEATLSFEQALKHNNSRKAVSRALYELAKIKMQARDYYEAYYTLCRAKHLDIDPKAIESLRLFNQGAILLMKRKFAEGLSIYELMLNDTKQRQLDDFLRPLFHMFRGYGFFCLGKHKQAIDEYKKLRANQIDDISHFNLYLCEGILLAQQNKYLGGIQFFNKAKQVFPNKIEPYIYIAVTLLREAREEYCGGEDQYKRRKHNAAIKAMEELNQGNLINDSNSNLLYHRAVINYYFRDWQSGLEDINRCIEKAEDNIPKYFYLRGLGYAANKELLKAINQFSICTSLDKTHAKSYVERAKCLFLIGDTDKAFGDLHTYMQLQQKDVSIHKWIGDLLYESKSYSDALKTYCEIEQGGQLSEDADQIQQHWGDICIMKAKCEVRMGIIQAAKSDILAAVKLFKSQSEDKRSKQVNGNSINCRSYTGKVDLSCLNLLSGLVNREPVNKINQYVKKLNEAMEGDSRGEVFKLIDCMFLIGCAAFTLGKFSDACSSLELTRQLLDSCSKRNKSEIKSEVSEEFYNLSLFKINFNLFLSLVGAKEYSKAASILKRQIVPLSAEQSIEAQQAINDLLLIIQKTAVEVPICIPLSLSNRNEVIPTKFASAELAFGKQAIIVSKLMFGLFHEVCCELYPVRKATEMLDRLTPTYVEDKPQAPWIRRNQFGVMFTENILKNDSVKLDTTLDDKSELQDMRDSVEIRASPLRDSGLVESDEQQRVANPGDNNGINSNIRAFKELIKLDLDIQRKLNRVLKAGSSRD